MAADKADDKFDDFWRFDTVTVSIEPVCSKVCASILGADNGLESVVDKTEREECMRIICSDEYLMEYFVGEEEYRK